MNTDIPEGATHIDCGPSIVEYLRIAEHVHDYWCDGDHRWVTFESGRHMVRDHWKSISQSH